jgi:hypothetical protein
MGWNASALRSSRWKRISDKQLLALGIQRITSMQINHHPVQSAGPGQEVAVKVDEPVRKWDEVFLVIESEPSRQLHSNLK